MHVPGQHVNESTLGFLFQFRRALAFGLLTAFLSSFGQTFFISLFLPHVTEELNIKAGDFGHIYAAATLVSGLLLPWLGGLLDRHGEGTVLPWVGAGLALGMVMMAWSPHILLLAAGLFMIRFFGQGAMGMIPATAMARYFVRRRGLALSISSLGYPFGEMLLPATALWLIQCIQWQSSVGVFALFVVLAVVLPGRLLTRAPLRGDVPADDRAETPLADAPSFRWYRDAVFLSATIPMALSGAFTGTILFLYQFSIGAEKGWSAEWIAVCFSVFALVRAVWSLVIGPCIDRFTAHRLFPWQFVPGTVAVLLLYYAEAPYAALAFYALLGIGFGSGSVFTAYIAEHYPRTIIGKVRGCTMSAGVLAAAAGPSMAGWLLNTGWSYQQLIMMLALLNMATFAAAFISPYLSRRRDGSIMNHHVRS